MDDECAKIMGIVFDVRPPRDAVSYSRRCSSLLLLLSMITTTMDICYPPLLPSPLVVRLLSPSQLESCSTSSSRRAVDEDVGFLLILIPVLCVPCNIPPVVSSFIKRDLSNAVLRRSMSGDGSDGDDGDMKLAAACP